MSLFLESMLSYGAPTLWSADIGKSALECAEPDITDMDCEFGVFWNLYSKLFHPGFLDPLVRLNWRDAGGHAGAEAGSQTQVVLFPVAGRYALVFTNTDGNDEDAAQYLMREVLHEGNKIADPSSDDPPSPVVHSSKSALFAILILVSAHVSLMTVSL
jgi:hypothetical protein